MGTCKYTNYERIRPKNVDDMVEIVYKDDDILDEICKKRRLPFWRWGAAFGLQKLCKGVAFA